MKLSISILCFNQIETTKRCIEHLLKHTNLDGIEFMLTDNGSTDGTLRYLNSCNLLRTVIIHHEDNIGFGAGHNYALALAAGTFFAVLNNDVFIEESGWVEKCLKPFNDRDVALVGLSGTPCMLMNDGNGQIGNQIDYIDGSLLIGRTSLFKKYGLFSSALHMFSFEDSDLSLRFRQAGYKIQQVHVSHRHERCTTRKSINRDLRKRITEHNQAVFLQRWGRYVKTRTFTGRILIKVPSWGIGDVLATTPVIAAIKQDHPGAQIDVATLHPEVLANNPNVARVQKTFNESEDRYDRVIPLEPNYAGPEPICRECAEIAAATVVSPAPQLFLSETETKYAMDRLCFFLKGNRPTIVCHFAIHHANEWHGRSWDMPRAWEFVNRLRLKWGNAIGIIEVGKDVPSTGRAHIDLINGTTLRELFAIVSQATLVVAIDSVVSHAARAFHKKSVLLFGATTPDSRVLNPTIETVISRADLDCLGCYQRRGSWDLNRDCPHDQACMEIPADRVYDAVSSLL